VDEFLNQNSNAHAAKIRDDLQSWLAQQQASLPAAFGCDYNPGRDGMAERAWAQALLAYLERKLAN
jgi:hypothetical protein